MLPYFSAFIKRLLLYIYIYITFFFFFSFSKDKMNNSNNNTVSLFDPRLKFVEQIVLATIFVSALLGNGFVLMFVIKKRYQRLNRMAFFVINLTVADLLVAFFSILPMLVWKSTIIFYGGDFLCRLVSFLMLAASYISVYT